MKYQNKYTEDGFSIKLLKKLAKALSKEQGLKLIDAKDLVAMDYGYADWNTISQQYPNPDRDGFFKHVYSNSFSDNLYFDYLRNYELKDSVDVKRRWALSHWSYLEAANSKPSSFKFERLSNMMLMQAVEIAISKHGAGGVLPQNLPNNVLGSLIDTWIEFRRKPSDSIEPYLKAVGAIYKHLSRECNEGLDGVDLTMECEVYAFNLRCERISRYSDTSFSKPTLETVLDMHAPVTMKQPDTVLDIIRRDTYKHSRD